MDYMIIVPLSLATAFAVSALDYWRYIRFFRGVLGWLFCGAMLWALGWSGAPLVVASMASAFTALAIIDLVARSSYVTVARR